MSDRLVGVLIAGFFGIGALAFGMLLRGRQRRFRSGVAVKGHVTAEGDSGGYGSAWYVVAYPVRGKIIETKVSRIGVPRQRPGNTIELVYDAEHPERAITLQRLNAPMDTILIWALLLVGSFVCSLAVVGLGSG